MNNGKTPTHERDKEAPAATAAEPQPAFFPDLSLISMALEAGRIGLWSWDIKSNRVTWSNNLEGIHRLPAGSFSGDFSFFEKDIHPPRALPAAAAGGARGVLE